MAQAHEKDHPYHLVEASPWPLVGSVGAGVLAVGMVLMMHGINTWVLWLGVALIILTMGGWWRDVIVEAEHQKLHTPVVQLGLRYGMILFIASEVMFFAAFFWAFFNGALYPPEAIDHTWPPPGIETFNPFGLPFMMTLVLLLSGCTVTWAHHALREGDRSGTLKGLGLTILLAVTFTFLQGYEYAQAEFAFGENIYTSAFYMATGFHGAHVIIGTIFLAVCFGRAYLGHFTPKHHFGFEAAAWYWHFVDVVWIFLFAAIYWWGS